jgi:type I restriction enzyme S subunit
MFTNLKPYPEYAESGVTWLGPTPVHWNVRRAKYLFRDIDVRSKTGHEEQLSVSHLTGVSPRRMKTITMFKAVSYVGHKTCLAGDLVVNTMWAWMGALGIAREAGLVSPAYNVYRPPRTSGVNVEFVAVLFRTPTYIAYFRSHSTGLRPSRLRFYPDELLATPVLLPPWDEQAAIVKYLGHANAQIDRAIASQRKLIALLEEQKQAVINQAVTRGLDATVAFRDSGLEVPMEMPSHWRVVALKRMLRALVDCEHKTAPYFEGGVHHVVRTTAVRKGRLEWAGTYTTSAEAFGVWTQRGMPEAGDVVFTREAPAGEACMVPPGHNVCLGQRTVLMKLDRDNFDAQYLVHQVYADPARLRIQVATQGSTVGHFNMDDIGRMPVFVPPLAEQCQITKHIAESTQVLEVTIGRAAQEIELLREFRTRLTADVVTGQLDIRDAAALLPELDPADLVSDVIEQDEDDLEAELPASLEEVDA